MANKHTLLDPATFWHVWRTQEQREANNLKTLKKLAECRLVCHASRSMIDSWRGQHGLIMLLPSGEAPGWVGEHPVFGRYRRNAEQYIMQLAENMQPLWRSVEIPVEISYFDGVKMIDYRSELAVHALCTALGNHGSHKACVRACLAELSDIVANTHSRFRHSENIVMEVIWPLIRVLQVHHGDSSLGMLILLSVLQIAGMASWVPDLTAMLRPLVSPDRSCAGRNMLWAFYNSCPKNKELEDTVRSVVRWLEKPIMLCHSVQLHIYVYMHED